MDAISDESRKLVDGAARGNDSRCKSAVSRWQNQRNRSPMRVRPRIAGKSRKT
jgi:hypothetical protein